MKLKLLTLFTLLTATIAFTNIAYSADYHYCNCLPGSSAQCTAGLDTNSGSLANPRRTFTHAISQFNTAVAGDNILLCRGGAFTSAQRNSIYNGNCTAGNRCSFTSYGTYPTPRPIITHTSNRQLFSMSNAGHEEGFNFSNLDLKCTGCNNTNGSAFFFYSDIDYVTLFNNTIDGFDIGVHLATTGTRANPVISNFITVNQNRIINSLSQGILGKANDLVLTNSWFFNNGSGSNRDHNIYLGGGNNVLVKGNESYQSSMLAGSCNGSSIVVHGTVNNMLIENNLVREDIGAANRGCWGITVDPGYGRAESFTNVTIRGNRVINVGNIAIGTTSCDTCVIEDNVIVSQQAFRTVAIAVPNRVRDSIDQPTANVTVRNNSMYVDSFGTGIRVNTEGNQYKIVSNSIVYTGISNFYCLDMPLSAASYTAIDNNVCYSPNVVSEFELGSGVSPTPLAAWKTSGFGTNSLDTDPVYANIATFDLSALNVTSSLVNNGHVTLSSISGIGGTLRLTTPDIGAYQSSFGGNPGGGNGGGCTAP